MLNTASMYFMHAKQSRCSVSIMRSAASLMSLQDSQMHPSLRVSNPVCILAALTACQRCDMLVLLTDSAWLLLAHALFKKLGLIC